ncbi:MAG: hypothetical protein M3160_06410 [Candidatus Eremiobacteraeota bacterium]|nr:hypothetical protein [Candidatus Eremiobacteraeota bacterium]
MVVICRSLQSAGIDATQWLWRLSDTDLMDLYLALRNWPHKLAERQIEMRRQWLHDVGLYQDATDLRLTRKRNAFGNAENQEN